MSHSWINSADFAGAQGVSVQAARAALRGALAGKSWRGRQLEVRIAPGAGGSHGLRYEVKIETREATLPVRPDFDAKPDDRTLARVAAIQAVLVEAPERAGRAAIVARTALATGVSRRSIYRWMARHEAQGFRGLTRKRPRNAGAARVCVSRAFDRAYRQAGHPDDGLKAIAEALQRGLRGLWASRAEQAGAAEVRRLAEHLLFELSAARRLALPEAACRLSRRHVERFAAYRVINQRRNDRKAFDDARPRIRRDWTGLLPMERVVADVKHLDVIVRRDDGSTAWPKIIAFMDASTARVFVHPVLLEPGEGVRQEHVIEAFLAMVAHPGWGFPQGLYLDNGAEFAALAKIDGALQLLNAPGARTLIYARPYNAAAKPIESLFARLDKQVFSLLPGYAGPNRLAKKTQTVGKPPAPYPGSWDAFCADLDGLIHAHNHRPIGGARRGRSPEEAYKSHVETGWRAVQVDEAELDAAFADTDSRRLDRGVLKIGGKRYSHPELAGQPSRTVVDLALPWRRGASPLARIGGTWRYLQAETLYPARWIEGAHESQRRHRAQARHVAALQKNAPTIDPVALKIRWGKAQETSTPPPTTTPTLDLGERPRQQAIAVRAAKTEPPGPSAGDRKRAREMAITEQLEKAQRSHG